MHAVLHACEWGAENLLISHRAPPGGWPCACCAACLGVVLSEHLGTSSANLGCCTECISLSEGGLHDRGSAIPCGYCLQPAIFVVAQMCSTGSAATLHIPATRSGQPAPLLLLP